ncbi:MAG: hypothetical protein OXE84_10585 [Rhodobacteraceae bacterium]|nr:hypothetical protein [Paracoccaceae bacterium]
MALDRAGLAEFVDQTDKIEPPVFIGREPVLAKILKVAGNSWDGSGAGQHGQAGATQIIQGAPGAGKSTILTELVRRAAAGGTDGVKTQVLKLSSGRITGPINILGPLATLIDPAAATDFLARYQTTRSLGGQLGAFGSSVGTERTTTATPRSPEPTLSAFHDWIQYRNSGQVPHQGLRGPIIIAIDEAQNMHFGSDDPCTSILRCIHEADPPLPLTLVLAGLGDTDARTTDMGLTRGKTLHDIGALSPDEVSDLTHRWCVHFGLEPTGQTAALDALAAPCEGWPRHLHFALQALGRDILRTPDAGPAALATVDWERVAAAAAISRLHYYRSQQSGAMANCPALIAAVLDDLRHRNTRPPAACRRFHVINSITRHARTHPATSEWQIPKGMDADSLADHLFHRGALQENRDGSLTFPIPSFCTYLVRDWIRMATAEPDSAPCPPLPAREGERILAAAAPHTEDEIIHWTTLAATWHRTCTAVAASAVDAAALAAVPATPTDADRSRATTVLATLEADRETPNADASVPALPQSLPHAERAVAALVAMIDVVRTAVQAVLDGTDEPFRSDTLSTVMDLPDQAVSAPPEEQLAWAIEYLTGVARPST